MLAFDVSHYSCVSTFFDCKALNFSHWGITTNTSTPVIKLCDVHNYSWHIRYCTCRKLTRMKVGKMFIHILRMLPTLLSLSLLRSNRQTRTVLNGKGIMIITVNP